MPAICRTQAGSEFTPSESEKVSTSRGASNWGGRLELGMGRTAMLDCRAVKPCPWLDAAFRDGYWLPNVLEGRAVREA